MARIEIRCLGTFQVTLDGAPITAFESNRVRALLVYLATEKAHPQRREALGGLLWADWANSAALSNLRYALSKLREAIGDRNVDPPFLLISRETIQFNPACDHFLDAAAFETGVPAAKLQFSAGNDRQDAIRSLQAALELYQGDFLGGITLAVGESFDEWVDIQREHYHRLALQALDELEQWHEAAGELKQALNCAYRQVELEPWLEEAHQQVMRLLALNGQRSQALAQYETCRKALAEQVAVEPSPETTRLFETIRDGKLDELNGAPVKEESLPPAPGEPPFKGLQYFDTDDADLFFGREQLTARLVGRLVEMVTAGDAEAQENSILCVVGASGSGKSSVVRAGLVPALKRDSSTPLPPGSAHWQTVILTPTAHPLEALAATLTRGAASLTAPIGLADEVSRDERSLHLTLSQELNTIKEKTATLLLIVDQFEELFTLCRSEAERTAFLDNLFNAASASVLIIIVLRADFYAHCAQYPLLRQALSTHQEYIGAMNVAELRRAIEEPARRNGWEFEAGLVDLILRDLGAGEGHPPEPGALPLLSHALLETWVQRSGRTLTFKGYAHTGGVQGAIARSAETFFSGLNSGEQMLARRIFLSLTELGEGTQDTRRRAPLAELISAPEQRAAVQGLLQTLADARLITLSEDTAEVAHEALIREWPSLRQWLSEDRDSLRRHRHLTESATAWDRLGRDEGELYRGARLAQALEWAAQAEHREELTPLESEYLEASRALAEQQAAEREAQRQRELEAARSLAKSEARSARRLRRFSTGLVVLLVIVAGLVVVSLFFLNTSQKNLRLSEAQRLAGQSNRMFMEGINEEVAALLALESLKLGYTSQGDEALGRASLKDYPVRIFQGHKNASRSIAITGDGTRIITGGAADDNALLFEVATGKLLQKFEGPSGSNETVDISADGRYVVTCCDADKVARVWDIATGKEIQKIITGNDIVNAVIHLTADGRYLLVLNPKGSYSLWEVSGGKEIREFAGHSGRVNAAILSPDDRYVLTSGEDGLAILWDAQSGEKMRTLFDPSVKLTAIAFTADGSTILTAGNDSTVHLWDAASGQEKRPIQIPEEARGGIVAISPDGRYVLTQQINIAYLVDAETGEEVRQFPQTTWLGYVALFTPDGQSVVTGSYDGMVRMWSIEHHSVQMELSCPEGQFWKAVFSPDGKTIAGGRCLWDASSGELLGVLPGSNLDGEGDHIFFTADSQVIAAAKVDGTIITWDARTHQVRSQFKVPPVGPLVGYSFWGAALSPDGKTILLGNVDGFSASLYDTLTGQKLTTYSKGDAKTNVQSIAFSPDGSRIAIAYCDSHVYILSYPGGEDLLTLTLPNDPCAVTIKFSGDGRYILAPGGLGKNEFWLFNAHSGEKIRQFIGHTAMIWPNADLSFDGKYAASSAPDNTTRLWDVESGKEVRRFFTQMLGTNWVDISPSGDRVVAANLTANGKAEVWLTVLSQRKTALCKAMPRSLTPEERTQYGITDDSPACPVESGK